MSNICSQRSSLASSDGSETQPPSSWDTDLPEKSSIQSSKLHVNSTANTNQSSSCSQSLTTYLFENNSGKISSVVLKPDESFLKECDSMPDHLYLCSWKVHYIVKWLCDLPFHTENFDTNKRKSEDLDKDCVKVLASDTDSDSQKSYSLIRSKGRNKFLKKLRKN